MVRISWPTQYRAVFYKFHALSGLTGIGRYVAWTLEEVDPVEAEAEGDYLVQSDFTQS